MDALATYLKEARLSSARTQAEVAASIGKSKATIVALEQGKGRIQNVQDVIQIARCVGADEVRALSLYFRGLVVNQEEESSEAELEDCSLESDIGVLLSQYIQRRSHRLADGANEEIQEVAPLSNLQVRGRIREALFAAPPLVSEVEYAYGGFPIFDILRKRLDIVAQKIGKAPGQVRLKIVDSGDWWEAAVSCVDGGIVEIQVRDDVWERASEDDGRARWTLSHELAHVLLHHSSLTCDGKIMFKDGAQTPGAAARRAGIPIFRSPEHQAQIAASEMLMPESVFLQYAKERFQNDERSLTAESVSERFNVSYQAAQIRLSALSDKIMNPDSE